MCGITGLWNFTEEAIDKQLFREFTNTLTHRGPDAEGQAYFSNETLALGHRRLSILDLSESGNQPMYSKSNRYCIVYNGEVFNFKEIKEVLLKKGIKFSNNTDTEVILAAFECFGVSCFEMFNGMWSMAIWDNQLQELTLCRDRFGIKPFYFSFIENKYFVFASETKAFSTLRFFDKTINFKVAQFESNGISAYGLGYSNFENIFQLMPGHYAKVTKKTKNIDQIRWWDINKEVVANTSSIEAQAEEFYDIFYNACKIRLVSDVQIGTALSGGLDSTSVYSTVYSILQNNNLGLSKESSNAYVATFNGLPQDETKFAEIALKYTGGKGVFLDNKIENLAQQIEEDTINVDSLLSAPLTSVSNIYKGMKQNNVTVSMDGHGVDEFLFGYRDMLIELYNSHLKNNKVTEAQLVKKYIISTYLPAQQKEVQRYLESLGTLLHQIKSEFNSIIRPNKYTAESAKKQFPTLAKKTEFFSRNPEYLIPYNESFERTLPGILRDFDRASMMNGVEIRMPFMDYRLVKFMFGLPLSSKVGKDDNKHILREAMKGKIDESLRLRKYKVGIGSPIEYWFKNELKEWSLDLLTTIQNKKSRTLFEHNFIKNYKENALKNTLNANDIRKAWQEINLYFITK